MARGGTPTILNSWSVRGDQQGNRRSITKKGARRTKASPSGGPDGSKHLPWDKNSLPLPVPLRQELLDFRHGNVSGRAVTACLCPGDGTNAPAAKRSASGSCIAGRRPNASSDGEARRRSAGNTPKPNVYAVAGNAKKPALGRPSNLPWSPTHPPRSTLPSRARGHAARGILVIFATDRAVSSRYALPVVLQLITAATSAAKPCTVCGTGNASTSGARARRLIDGHATKTAPQDETEGRGPATRRQIVGRGRCLPVGRPSAVIGALLKRR